MATTETSVAALQLIRSYLEQRGFSSTTKAFTKELRSKKPAADTAVDLSGTDLEGLVEMWQKDKAKDTQQSSSSDTDSGESSSGSEESEAKSTTSSASSSSSSGTSRSASSSDSSVSDSEEDTVTTKTPKVRQRRSKAPSSSSSCSSSSESDADDEDDIAGNIRATKTSKTVEKPKDVSKVVPTPATTSQKRKRDETSSESSSSSSESDSESTSASERPASKRLKSTEEAALTMSSASSASSSSSSESDTSNSTESSSDEAASIEDLPSANKPNQDQPGDDDIAMGSSSSSTIVGDGTSLLKPALNSSNGKPARSILEKRRHVGAQPTPLATLSAKATPDSHISNAYQSYDYADRAYGDLSVTRGKGFTKEKNKKKRGSYRGGAIDISGGKAFKFED